MGSVARGFAAARHVSARTARVVLARSRRMRAAVVVHHRGTGAPRLCGCGAGPHRCRVRHRQRRREARQHPHRQLVPHARRWTDQSEIDRLHDLRAVIRLIANDPQLARIVDVSRIGAVGHSLGGYTVVGMAGGWADVENARDQGGAGAVAVRRAVRRRKERSQGWAYR